MQAQIIDVTPTMAREYLLRLAPYQRSLDKKHVSRLSEDMLAGRWVPNGSPVRFDANGQLCDGQHRLSACVLSGVTLRETVIVGDLPVDANQTIDTSAKPRSIAVMARAMKSLTVPPTASCLAAAAFEKYNFEFGEFRANCTPMERVRIWESLPEDLQYVTKKLEALTRGSRITTRGALAGALRCVREDHRAFAFYAAAFANTVACPPAGRVLYNTLARGRGMARDKPGFELNNAWCTMRAYIAYLHSDQLQLLRPPTVWPEECRTLATFNYRQLRKRDDEPPDDGEAFDAH